MAGDAQPATGASRIRTGYPSSIQPFPAMIADWDASKLAQSLKDLYDATVAAAQDRIDWYDRKGASFGFFAQWLRLLVIVLAGLGTVAPLLGQFIRPLVGDGSADLVSNVLSAQFGYIALATAAILVALDNFFGYTSGWMRYRVAQAELVRRLSLFRYDWAARLAAIDAATPLTAEEKRDLITLHRTFVDGLEAMVESETRMWANRLQVNIAAFERQNKLGAALEPPGSLQASVDGWPALKPASASLTLDGQPLQLNDSGVAARGSLPAGTYTLRLTAEAAADGTPVTREKPVTITANTPTKVKI